MPVYMILDAEVHSAAKAYEKLKEAAFPSMWHAMGENIVVAGDIDVVLAGEWHPQRVVMLKFPSRAEFDALMSDPDYQPWKKLRESLTTIKAQVILEGV